MTKADADIRSDPAGDANAASAFGVRRSGRGRGFTLIELLVVVAIIVALLAMLLPSMGKAISVTHRVMCASNLKQFGVAGLSYAADHYGFVMKIYERGVEPWPLCMGKNPDSGGSWNVASIGPYTMAFNKNKTNAAIIEGLGIGICPDIDVNLINDFYRIRNAGHPFIETQYAYFGGSDRMSDPFRLYNGAAKQLMQSRVGDGGRIWMTDLLYKDASDLNGRGGWRYNHGKYGWAFNEYDWMPNQKGLEPLITGINRMTGDGAVQWKSEADFEHMDLMFNDGLYPDPRVNRGDAVYF